jgi:hypothetical protein
MSTCDETMAPCDTLRAHRAECPSRTRLANITGPSSEESGVPHRSRLASYANPSEFRTPAIFSGGCSLLWSQSRSGPCPCPISHKATRLTANANMVRTASDDATTNTTPVKRARPLSSSRGAATRRCGLAASSPLPSLPGRRSRRSGPSHRVASSRTFQASWLRRTSSCRSCGL